jgi:cobalt-zinc-cadmium efflux system outer membrane protein
MRTSRMLFLATLLIAGGLLRGQQTRLTLADLERMALAASPSLQQSAADVRAAAGRARQAGLYPNPVMGMSGDHVAGGAVLRGGDLGGFVEQRVVTGGKLGLARKEAEQTRLGAEQMQEAERLRVLAEIRTLYYRALGEQRLLQVRDQISELAARTEKTWRELANLGQSDRPDVLAAGVEAQRASLGLVMARNAADRTWREIAALTGRPDLRPTPLEGDLEAIPKLDPNAALQRIYAESPELRAAEANFKRAQLLVDRERSARIPDLQLRGGVRYNKGVSGVGPDPEAPIGIEGFFDVGMEIPLFNRNQGAIEAARAEAERARLDASRLKLSLARRFAAVYREYQDSVEAAARYRESMIPAARQAYELYSANFAQMAAPYTQVLLTQRNLFQLEQEYVDVLVNAWRAAVEIDSLLVTEMP